MANRQANPYPLRLPYELMEKLRVVASSNDRSINAEISQLAKKAVAIYEAEHGKIVVELEE